MKPHKHAEVIKAWADGAQIQYDYGDGWEDCNWPQFEDGVRYRVKPEKSYPRTRMTMQELGELWNQAPFGVGIADITCYVANAALRHAIDEGQVVPLSEVAAYVDKRVSDVAKVVRFKCFKADGKAEIRLLDLESIIARVKS